MTAKAQAFRQEQKDILHGKGSHAGCSHAVAGKKKTTIGDVTSLNITMLKAGGWGFSLRLLLFWVKLVCDGLRLVIQIVS